MGSNDCCLCFVRVAHGLDHDHVSAGFGTCLDYLFEYFYCIVKCEITHGFQEFARRAYVDRDISIVFAACFFSSLLAEPDCSCNYLGNVIEFESVGTESIGVYDV